MLQNKHIIRASFIALFLAILASIMFYRYFTINNIVVESVIHEHNKISSHYTNEIWNKYSKDANLNKFTTIESALSDNYFKQFVDSSIAYLSNLERSKISVLTNKGVEFLTTEQEDTKSAAPASFIARKMLELDEMFLKHSTYKDSITRMLGAGVTHNILINTVIGNESTCGTYVESFYPIINPAISQFNIEGGIRIITNITHEYNEIKIFATKLAIFLLVVFAIFFSIIIFNTHHAQKVIDQQVANNKFLEEARIKAESESSAKTEFLANVSHELRTPLNAIIGFSEVILSEAYGKLEHPQYAEYIQDINNSGKHLLSVINDILDFSKAAADKLKVDVIEVDATKLLSSSLRFVKPRADEAKVTLVEKLPKEHVVIKADPKRLKQALLNLLSNSVKFTPENGSVTLELEKLQNDKIVNIRVVDTGIGMTEKDIPKAMASFGQVDNKLSRKYEGTGLGLPLTKKLVELMGGKFEITSKLGVGTTVTITFKYEEIA